MASVESLRIVIVAPDSLISDTSDPDTHSEVLRSRSLRIHGCVTKIRLENLFWDILAEIAASDGYTTNSLIAKLYDELLEYRGEIENFASFLRVSCLRYLSLRKGTTERPALAVVAAHAA
jgi:predicted DNA-binding ribbon-helix-helix protein